MSVRFSLISRQLSNVFHRAFKLKGLKEYPHFFSERTRISGLMGFETEGSARGTGLV